MADGSESSNEAKKVSPILASQFQLALLQLVEKANLQKQTTIAFPLASTSTGSAEEYRNHDVAAKIISLFPRPVKPPPVAKIPSKKKLQKKVPADDIVKKPAICTIPYNRVRMLMKTAPNITNVSLEAITLTAKAAELFIAKVARDSFSTCKTCTPFCNEVQYQHIAQSVRKSPQQMAFLFDFLPFKVKAKDYISHVNNKSSDNTTSQGTTTFNDTT